MHLLFLGLILGWGAAIPVGPVNLEVTRRNLRFGSPSGIATGLGACLVDLTYLVLLLTGALILLQHPDVLNIIGFVGSIILAWFGIMALRSKPQDSGQDAGNKKSLLKNGFEGYLMTFFNPYTILFWASVSSQITLASQNQRHAILYAGTGVILGTVSWVLFLNILLHFTRHKLSPKAMHRLNIIGGVILILFAVFGVLKVLF